MTSPEAPAADRRGLETACVAFCHRLRELGLAVPTGAAADLLRGADVVGPENRRAFHAVSRALLVDDVRQWPLYDAAFNEFWRTTQTDSDTGEFLARGSRGRDEQNVANLSSTRSSSPEGEDAGNRTQAGFGAGSRMPSQQVVGDVAMATRASWSASGPANRHDGLSTQPLLAARDLLPLAKQMSPTRRLPRRRPGAVPRRLNWRRTLRETARHGRIMGLPVFDDTVLEQRRVVVLADASRSMQPYASTVLGVAHLLATASDRTEVFVFATALSRISDHLRRRPADAVAAIRRTVPDWGTGTRVGAALAQFNREWSRRVLASTGVVVLITDGLDAGDIAELAMEARVVRQRCWRLVWVNPLAGGPGFEPRASGMRALLPQADVLLSCRDKSSVVTLLRTLHDFKGTRSTDPIVAANAARWAPWRATVQEEGNGKSPVDMPLRGSPRL